MKYLNQAMILAAVTFAAELIKLLLPLPVPASIYGLIMLFLLLKTGVLKMRQVEDVGNFLLEWMPLLLVPASTSFLTVLDTIQGMLLPVLVMGFIGTMAVMVTAGHAAQWMIRRRKGAEGNE